MEGEVDAMSRRAREQMQGIPALRFRMGEVSSTEAVENAEGEANGNSGSIRLQSAPWNLRTIESLGGRWFKGQPFAKTEISDNGLRYCIHYGELFTKYGCVISRIYSRTNSSATVKSKAGDILFPASDVTPEGLGRCSVVLQSDVILGGDLICFRQDEVDSEFLGYAINNVGAQIIRFVTGTTVRHSSADKLKMVHISLPILRHEQQKIGSFFRSLDALIEGREKALGKLESLKKAMLEKMFPQGDVKIPEVRFKGFEGEWKFYRFDEVFQHVQSKAYQIQAEEYLGVGRYPVVDQGQLPIVGYSNNATKVCKAKENPVIVFGDHTRIVKYVDFDFVVGADGTQLLRASDHDLMFLKEVICGLPLPNMGYSRHYKYLQESIFLLPGLSEQKKIGAYFRSLDALLAARREEVKKLRDLKKAFLERMFV